jgi:pimeloyl-ACP methyl ester carboxylesterase
MGAQAFEIEGLYTEHYPGDIGVPLLFIHGSWGGSWMFQNYMVYLSNGGWDCYALNLRNHYKSYKTELYGITHYEYAHDVMAVAKQLSAPPVLIGYGMGAQLVQLAIGMKCPAAGAVFISAKRAFVAPQEVPAHVMELPELLVATPIPPSPDISPKVLATFNTLMAEEVEPRSSVLALLRGAYTSPYNAIQVPYLVLNGGKDDAITRQEGAELASVYQGPGTLKIVPAASHEGILAGAYWREAANELNAWLQTYDFHQRR